MSLYDKVKKRIELLISSIVFFLYSPQPHKASKKREWKKATSYNPRQWHNHGPSEDNHSSAASGSSQGFQFDDFDDEDEESRRKKNSQSSQASSSSSSSSSSSKMNGRREGAEGSGGGVVELTRGVPSSAPIHRISRPSIPRPFTKHVTKPGRHAFAEPVTSLKVQREHKVHGLHGG